MDRKKATKIVSEGDYLLKRTLTLKVKNKQGKLVEDEFLVESLGAMKIFLAGNNSSWYEVWANLKSESTGKTHKMLLERLIKMFPKI